MSTLRYILVAIYIGIACTCLSANSHITAETLLQNLRGSIASKPAAEVLFTINGGNGPVQGSATIAGSAFTFTTPQLKVWYDGRTQWTYLASTGEVSISEPDIDELIMSNPFAILNSYHGHYTSRRLPDVGDRKRVELVPKDKNAMIKKIVIFITQDKNPAALTIDLDNNKRIEVVIDKFSSRAALPQSTFVYNSAQCPASEIIDLR